MIRLLLSDLRRHAGSWAWTAVVAAAASVLGLFITLSTAVLVAEAVHRPLTSILQGFPWGTLGLVCAATLATTCLAVVVSARAGALAGEQSLGQVLRARD